MLKRMITIVIILLFCICFTQVLAGPPTGVKPTLAPTSPPTPVPTPTPTPTEQPTQSSVTDNVWGNWGWASTETPPTLSPFPSGMIQLITVVPVMPTPTVAPVTPTPTPNSLQLGFTDSDAVRAVQKRLKELGFYKSGVDGYFGPVTEAAVKAFQKANGLTVDGKVGEKTLTKMNGKGARPIVTPDLSRDVYLQLGTWSKKVETMQRRLIELGWLEGSVTGIYDEVTEAAVSAFQKEAELWVDGIASPDTLKKLYSSSAPRSSNPIASKRETREHGSEGNGNTDADASQGQ